MDSLRLRHQVHTFVAFIDIKKAFDSCWVETTLVRLHDVGILGRLWHLLANFLCGTLSQVRLGDSTSQPWVDSGVAQGRVLSPLLFNLLVDSLLAESQAHLQHALDVVHTWGLHWRFSFGISPTKSAVMVFGPLPQYRYLGVTLTDLRSW